MSTEPALHGTTAEELFEEAPCGYLICRPDGTILRVNRTFEEWTGRSREDLHGRVRFQDLLTRGGQVYHETHYAPLLRMQGTVREIAVNIVRGDGSQLPALINSVLVRDEEDQPQLVRTTIFDATDRRRYEHELLRAREREHEIALELQRSLLAGAIPASAQVELEVFYSPAERGTEAGGDWYDAFWLEEGTELALAVGDVVGRGIDAAAAMGQLRSALRALAAAGGSPGEVLSAVDDYSARHEVGRMTTLIYGRLDVASGRLRFACAGHPPPLVISPHRAPEFAWGGRSLPICAYADAGASREEAEVRLQPGEAVLLYTDGLVERRSEPDVDGMARLRECAQSHGGEPLPELVGHVARALKEPGAVDDVCLLAARRTSEPALGAAPVT